MKRPAVFLDRDNTIIHNDGDLGDPDALKLIQGAAPAIASLCGLAYKVIVVTNQGGVARGKYSVEDVEATHERLEQMIRERANGARIDGFYYCPFHPQGTVAKYKKEHPTRKPKPGMLLQAAEDHDIDLAQSWMVGDAIRDIEAGAAAGCRTILLSADWTDTSLADLRKISAAKAEGKPTRGRKKVTPDFMAKGLVEAVRIIASQRKPESSDQISQTRIAGKRWDAEAMAKLQSQGRKPAAASEKPAGDAVAPDTDSPEATDTADADSKPTPTPTPVPPRRHTSAQGRPFVPWTKARPLEEAPPEPPPSTNGHAAAHPGDSPAATPAEPDPPKPRRRVASAPEPVEMAAPVLPSDEPADVPPAVPTNEAVESAPDASPLPQPGAPAERDASTPGDPGHKTLRLILNELRMQRGTSGEVPQLAFAAIVIQAVVFICLLGALWMGSGQGGDIAFLRWISVAILLQLAVIATLLFGKMSS